MRRGREDLEGMKTWNTSTRSTAWRPAVEELGPLQQASESLHDEAWVGRVVSSSLRISQEVGIETGCVVTVSHLPSPGFGTSSPGCGREATSWVGWTQKIAVPCKGEGVLSAFLAAGDWERKGIIHTAWSVPPLSSCLCSNSYGYGTAVGPRSGERC